MEPDEGDKALLIELRQHQQTPEGRAEIREQVVIEHNLGTCWAVVRAACMLSGIAYVRNPDFKNVLLKY